MKSVRISTARGWKEAGWQYWLLVAFLGLVFLTGGSSRGDVQSLALLRPVSIGVLGIGLLTLRAEHVRRFKSLFLFAGLILLLVGLYLIPLPASLLSLFPAGEMIDLTEAVAGPASHSASLAAAQSWNAFYALFVPLAVLVIGAQLSREDMFRLLPALLVLGFASGLVGFLQILGSREGPLYFYQITNNGTAVGFFANRNHQAVLLAMLFPMLAVFASAGIKSPEQAAFRQWIALAGGIFLVPLILVTGSRAGLIIGTMSIAATFWIYRKPEGLAPAKRKTRRIDWRIPAAAGGILALGAVTLLMSRAEAINRLLDSGSPQDNRQAFWKPIANMAMDNLPFGTGPGSIAEAYARIEPMGLLDATYLNRAHNDWLEVFANFGVLGALLLVAAVATVAIRGWIVSRDRSKSRRSLYARMGMAIIVAAALGSVGDYPLRTPIMASIFVIAAFWFSSELKRQQ